MQITIDEKTLNALTRDASRLLESVVTWALSTGLRILLVSLLVVVAVKVGRGALDAIFARISRGDVEYAKRIDTLHSITAFSLKAGIVTVGAFVVLGQLGINLGPILAAAGILGLAVGFGAQTLVQDVISGFFLLVEDQVRVGDVVQIGDKGGLVERITLRLIVLRDPAGNVHYIRNGKVDVVTNMTKDYSRYVFDIGVAYREDPDRVAGVLREIDEDMRADPAFGPSILEPIEILGVDRFDESAVVLRARTKTRPAQQWSVGREFNRRIKLRFDELGIEIPYPHRTLFWGDAPPPRLQGQELSGSAASPATRPAGAAPADPEGGDAGSAPA